MLLLSEFSCAVLDISSNSIYKNIAYTDNTFMLFGIQTPVTYGRIRRHVEDIIEISRTFLLMPIKKGLVEYYLFKKRVTNI